MTGPDRVVLHPSRPPGVHDAVLAMAGRGLIELVDATSDDDVAVALRQPGSVLVSHRWRADFLTDGLAWIQCLGVGVDQFPLADLAARGVPLRNARGVMAGCVAEHAFALLLTMTRRVSRAASRRPVTSCPPSISPVAACGLSSRRRSPRVIPPPWAPSAPRSAT